PLERHSSPEILNTADLTDNNIIGAGVIVQLLMPLLHHPTAAVIVSLIQKKLKIKIIPENFVNKDRLAGFDFTN
ncbi:hypothetical protein O4H25_15515, partial [Staphylococcus equorum]|uniref:hypothetical protein n=1 Tax=Staphylococcus equorum TaxID=246432 RepID=UPI0022AFC4CC